MNLENLNKSLSLLANIGVVLGLIFLAFELQQNTSLSKASAYRDTIQEIADWREFIAEPQINECYAKYQRDGFDSVAGTECGIVNLPINNIIGIYETAFYDHQYGFIGDSEWSRLRSGGCRHYRITQESGFELGFITEEFKEYLDTSC